MKKVIIRIIATAVATAMVIGVTIATTYVVNKNAIVTTNVKNGLSAYEIAVSSGFTGSIQDWLKSLEGKSAYEVAKEAGYTGTETEYGAMLNKLASSEQVSIKTASFNKAGQLIITLSDDTTINGRDNNLIETHQ